jgi:hypothetical protein
MPASDEPDDRAFSGGPSMCAGIARTVADVDQTVDPARHSKGISHVWSSCVRNSSKRAARTAEKPALRTPSFNRISLPIPIP